MTKHIVSYFNVDGDRMRYVTDTDVNILEHDEFVDMVRDDCNLPKDMPDYEIAPSVDVVFNV